MLIGCCGWAGARRRYYQDFRAVELQSTFYQPPPVRLTGKWRAEAPAEFLFCMKAWQLITHPASSPTYRRLKTPVPAEKAAQYGGFQHTAEVWSAWRETLAVAQALRAAVIVFQCPASFGPTADNLKNLIGFFRRIERGPWLAAWEPRGEWPEETVRDACRQCGLAHCVDPFRAEPVWGDAAYFRLHGRGGYRYRYTDADLRELAGICRRQRDLGRSPVYVMFNNMSMREDALRFRRIWLE